MVFVTIPRAFVSFCVVAILVSGIGSNVLPGVYGLGNVTAHELSEATSGSGTAGTGSIAVSALVSSSSATTPVTTGGAGGFSGTLKAGSGEIITEEGFFSLTSSNTLLVPPLPCGPAGEVGASGRIISGSFQGQEVVIFGCTGTNTPGGFLVIDDAGGITTSTYNGRGSGTVSTFNAPLVAAVIVEGKTIGSGSAGSGGLGTAMVIGAFRFLPSPSPPVLHGEGAFTGSESFAQGQLTGTFTGQVVLQPGCTLDFSGAVDSGGFSGSQAATNVSLVKCPPTNSGPQPVIITTVIGPLTSPIYAGHGSGDAIAIPNLIEA